MANRHSGSGGVAAVCRAIAEPLAAGLGLRIWDVRFVKEGADWFLRVYIDRDGGVGLDDCVALTRLLSPALDEADPIDQSAWRSPRPVWSGNSPALSILRRIRAVP